MSSINQTTKPIKVKDLYKTTKLWQHLESKNEHKKIAHIEDLIDYATPLLYEVIETFPTYTLHYGEHQLNILNLMADLLGERINELTSLETAILILSAFYHDIGMVFTKSERESLRKENDFEEFLNKNSAAKLAVNSSNELPIDIAEWYCRWIHPKRVWLYLNKKEDKIIWDGGNFKKQLAEVCLSHNEDIKYLKDDNKFETDFLGADLRFCAIILRLADILDFDNSRSPESVFEYIKLDNSETHREKVSYAEWKKHLDSRGFSFNEWHLKHPYEIDFTALPSHPAVESDIRTFLDVIELEFQKCLTVIKFCSTRWKNFVLPDKIKRNNIRSQGYKYGNFKFTLNQEQILNMLMGENLYDDHYVFVRELIQNAIDTTRDREFHEHNNGNIDFKAEPIEVSTWIDKDGYRWLRMDDYGMGMTEDIINKFFLRVGSSYYNSDEFKVRKLAYQKTNEIDFTPISRFGIGFLSCFIAGDRVEVSTRSIDCDGENIYPIRLSLKGLHNFYIMQVDKDIPFSMPTEEKQENDYRGKPGTSIAVRIRMDKDQIEFNAEDILKKILLNPPVKVLLKNVGLIGEYTDFIGKKICEKFTLKIATEDIKKLEKTFDVKITSKFQAHLYCVDLSRLSPNKNLKGLLSLIYIPPPKIKYDKKKHPPPHRMKMRISDNYISDVIERNADKYGIEISGAIWDNYNKLVKSIEIDLTEILSKLLIKSLHHKHFIFSNLLLTHNGIAIPNEKGLLSLNTPSINFSIYSKDGSLIDKIGLIELKDELRPDLSISRNRITRIDWLILSQLNYTVLQALKVVKLNKKVEQINMFYFENFKTEDMLYTVFLKDKLIFEKKFWVKEKIINSKNKKVSIEEIIQSRHGKEIVVNMYYDFDSMEYDYEFADKFEYYLVNALLQKHCDVVFKVEFYKKKFRIKKIASKKIHPHSDDVDLFPPLTFVKYVNFNGLSPQYSDNSLKTLRFNNIRCEFLNIEHKFSKWFIKSSKILYTNYSVHYWTLFRAKEINTINEILQRLRKILPDEFKPAKDLIITVEDLKVGLPKLKR